MAFDIATRILSTNIINRSILHLLIVLSWICVTNSITLNCNFKYLKDLDDNTLDIYACESMNFTNRAQSEPINYVTNIHEIGRRDRDVKIFIIKLQVCHFLPTKIEHFFPHLQEIEVDSSGLRQLFRENFASLTKLTMAIFPNNEIEFLPGDLFIYNPRLTHIDFSQNRIKSVGRNFFNSLHNLQFLMFDDNECYEELGMATDEIELIREEILQNCSSVAKPEKRIVVRVEEVKVVEKTPEKKEEVKVPLPPPKNEEPGHVKSHSAVLQTSLELFAICFHLHVFATLLSEIKIKF